MTRITWDAQGQRRYHIGIDRGMLYLNDGTVVPWSGLVSVTESPTGISPTATYLDGQKILNVPAGEGYAATIESFAMPPEFAPCAGWTEVSGALYATEQARDTFAFSYRTMTGNDLTGLSDYKVHLVYGALAKTTNFTRASNSASPQAKTYSWNIVAAPQSFGAQIRPTAHVIFDTRDISPTTITTLEGLLYGDSTQDPSLPTTDQIALLLSS
jgi:hypothetical protein